MKRLLAVIALLAILGQLPFQNKVLDFMFEWEIDRWNADGKWKRWLEWRAKWIRDI